MGASIIPLVIFCIFIFTQFCEGSLAESKNVKWNDQETGRKYSETREKDWRSRGDKAAVCEVNEGPTWWPFLSSFGQLEDDIVKHNTTEDIHYFDKLNSWFDQFDELRKDIDESIRSKWSRFCESFQTLFQTVPRQSTKVPLPSTIQPPVEKIRKDTGWWSWFQSLTTTTTNKRVEKEDSNGSNWWKFWSSSSPTTSILKEKNDTWPILKSLSSLKWWDDEDEDEEVKNKSDPLELASPSTWLEKTKEFLRIAGIIGEKPTKKKKPTGWSKIVSWFKSFSKTEEKTPQGWYQYSWNKIFGTKRISWWNYLTSDLLPEFLWSSEKEEEDVYYYSPLKIMNRMYNRAVGIFQ